MLALAALIFAEHLLHDLRGDAVAGFAWQPGTFVTWGERVLWRNRPGAAPRVLRKRGTALRAGGCLFDADGDGKPDLVASEPGALVWFRYPDGARHVIDTGADSPDIIPAVLLGRRGILLIHKHAQVRFYEPGRDPASPWHATDLYSIYTPSWQGGLRLADIDRDGRTDILCGNYWIRSPESWELPWRLFAINTWTEEERSGMLRLAWADGRLAAAQREMAPARLAWFTPPADPREQWPAQPLGTDLRLSQPDSLEVADFDGDSRPDLLAAEGAGAGRIVIFRGGAPEVAAYGKPVRRAIAADLNGDGRPDILVLRQSSISWYENRTPASR